MVRRVGADKRSRDLDEDDGDEHPSDRDEPSPASLSSAADATAERKVLRFETWNARTSVDGAVEQGLQKLRGMPGVRRVTPRVDEERSLTGMIGREVVATVDVAFGPSHTVRMVSYSRWGRNYLVVATPGHDRVELEVAERMLASVRAAEAPDAGVDTPPGSREAN